jgi:hypothetical protein
MSNSVSIDGERVEMSWNEKIEELLIRWSKECDELSQRHHEASKKKKRIHYGFQIPIIITPFVLGFSSSFYGEEHDYNRYVNSYGNLLLGIMSGINTFINYGATGLTGAITRWISISRNGKRDYQSNIF